MQCGIVFQVNWPLGRRERFVQKAALALAQPPAGQQGTKQALWRKWNGGKKKNKKTDEIFPISEANRLLSPSLADVCGWLLLFDGANLNIPPVPWDCGLCLSERDNIQKEDCVHILCHLIMTFRRTYSSQIHDVVVIAPFWRNTINCVMRAWLNHQSSA